MSVLCCFLQLWRLLDSKLQTNTASSITDTLLDLKLLPFSLSTSFSPPILLMKLPN